MKWAIQAAVSPDAKPVDDRWKEMADAFASALEVLPNSPKAPLDNVWYRCSLPVPPEAEGKSVWLRFQHIRGIARLYVNGTFVKELVRPDWEADITAAAKPGQNADVLVYVTRTGQGTDAKFTDDKIQVPVMQQLFRMEAPAALGLMGKVELLLRGRRSHLDSAWVESVWQPRTLRVHVQTGGEADSALKVEGEVVDGAGKTALVLPAVPFQTGDALLSAAWPDVVPWELDHGVLYSLHLWLRDASGKRVDELAPVSFGFRELRVDGRKFLLNGHPVAWRFSPIVRIDGQKTTDFEPAGLPAFEFLRSVGFNVVEVQPHPNSFWNRYSGPWPIYPDEILDAADKWGMGLSISVPQFTDHWFDYGMGNDPAIAAQYRREVEGFMARYRNHPSIVTWVGAMNFFDHDYGAQANTPLGMGTEPDERQKSRPVDQLVEKGCAMIEEIDPTRPAYAHHAGNAGPISASNQYLGLTPIAEFERWPSRWAAEGEKPWLAIEFGVPYWADFWMRNRSEKTGQIQPFGEAAVTEFAADLLGDEAYALEDEGLRQKLDWLTRDNVRGDGSGKVPPNPELRVDGNILAYPAVRRVYAEYGRRINRSWRTWQVTGWSPWLLSWGLRFRGSPEAFMPDVVQAYRDTEQPLLAYVGGAPDFYLRTHAFQAGETVQKTAVFIWDGPGDHALQATWQAVLDGKTVASGKLAQALHANTVAKLPIEFAAPAVARKSVLSLVLQVTSAPPGPGTADHFDMVIWPGAPPKPAIPAPRRVVLFDPAAESGWVAQAVPGAAPLDPANLPAWGPDSILILGRHSLRSLPKLPYAADDVEKGLRVVVLEQDQADLFRLGLRSVERAVREGVSTFPPGPVTDGLDDADFRDWRGSGSLLPEEDEFRWWSDLEQLDPFEPARGARWGTHGSVASVLIETPHKGSFRPLLRCGFDQSYTPLLEWRHGAGGVWFCQLDLTGRVGAEPAATRVAGNLLGYVAGSLPAVRKGLRLDALPAPYADQVRTLGFKVVGQAGDDALAVGLPGSGAALQIAGKEADAAPGLAWKQATAFADAEIAAPAGDVPPPNLRRFRFPVSLATEGSLGKIVRLGDGGGFLGVPLAAADGPYVDDLAKEHARLSRWRVRQLYAWVLGAAGIDSGNEVASRVTTLSAAPIAPAAPSSARERTIVPVSGAQISQVVTAPGLEGAALLASPLPPLQFKDQSTLSANHDILNYGGDKAEGVFIDLAKLLDVKPSPTRMAILKATVRVDKARKLTLRFGFDFWGSVRLNGTELIRVDAPGDAPRRDAVRVPGNFHEGDNDLVVQVVSGISGFGCWMDIDDDLSGKPLRIGNEIGQEPFWGKPMPPYNPGGYSLYCEPMRKRDDPYAWMSW